MKTNTKKTFKFFYRHAVKYKYLFIFGIISLTVAVVSNTIIPIYYKQFFDSITDNDPSSQLTQKLISILVIILGLNFLSWLFWRIVIFIIIKLQSVAMSNIYQECFSYLHKHSYDFFNNNFVGSLVKKINRLVNSYEGMFDRIFFDFFPLFLRTGITFTVLFLTNTLIGAIFFIWVIFFLIFNYFFSLYKFKYDVERSETDSKVTAFLADTITNHLNIKLFASLSQEEEDFGKVTDTWRSKTHKSWTLDNLIESIQGFLMIILEFLLIYTAVYFWQRNLLTVGDFILIQSFLFGMFSTLWNFGRIIRATYSNLADAEEMIVIFETPHAIRSSQNAPSLKINKGQIDFKNVNFSYDSTIPVLQDFNLYIKPLEKIALVGPSGEGKSTLVKLLLRLFDINKGEILVDNQNITQIDLDSLRKNISLVPQDPILFHRTLYENIKYGNPNASEEELINASKMAYCHDFIEKLPQKYDTYVGERGIKLSGGQRQRVAIARAILQNSPIIILDEATSSLDSHSELLIQKALYNLMENKTAIVIAHRLSTLSQMHRIIVIKEGKIAESGTEKELLQKENSLFKKLWDIQMKTHKEVLL
ncbi:MAG: Xenobiotic-transporting ATPase [Candidatus Peregrinibacteria bacterium GW2011_GWA2_33_10]|nr:MAG: Xenobiotic-transporting ATPase [Candidatus Peregrinibacteria bacterium GW2011_GWA2_33_10]KKP40759.1 MAG: hypothetical protein UR30_C0004G0017 [Candidatus Peregrinibacteria bacterium GW2011_GWC2_33_13]OGJ51116.1 MAG: hypothetical protein A2229_04720 [Candidatus Peregrinibacteria bacterium RIFOXYA2_FULL_33_7]